MKKIFFLASMLSLILIVGCVSNDEMQNPEIEYLDFDFAINENEITQFSLGSFSTEGSTEVTKQPKYSAVSQITFEETGLVYNYEPNSNFNGIDYVEITKSSSNGDTNFNLKTIFRITILIKILD